MSYRLQYVRTMGYEWKVCFPWIKDDEELSSGRSSSSDRTGYITRCCNASHILIPPTRRLCFQHLELLLMASTDTVAGAPLNPPNHRRRPGRQPVSCAECRRSVFPPHPASCLPTSFQPPCLRQAEAQVRSQGNQHRLPESHLSSKP